MNEKEFDIDLSDLPDLNLDIEVSEVKPEPLEIEAIVTRLFSNERKIVTIENSMAQFEHLIPRPPVPGECYKMLGGRGGFSAMAPILYILEREPLEELYISTFNVGPNEAELLEQYADRIGDCFLVTSTLQATKTGRPGSHVKDIFERNDWDFLALHNHTKIFLMKTAKNFYVIETSANLNGNPRLEQYSFENSEKLYYFYRPMFEEIRKQVVKTGRLF